MRLFESKLRYLIRKIILSEAPDDPIPRYREYIATSQDDIKSAIDEALAIMEPFRWAYSDLMDSEVQRRMNTPDYDPMALARVMGEVNKIKSRFSERDAQMIGAVVEESMRGNM